MAGVLSALSLSVPGDEIPFASRCRFGSPNSLIHVEDDSTGTFKHGGLARVSPDADALIQAFIPFTSNLIVAYFEVKIIQAASRSGIGIGLVGRTAHMSKPPGHEHGTYGYIGDSGYKFSNETSSRTPRGATYGPIFSSGDVVGCGIDYERGHIFFTLNGRDLGMAFQDARLSGPAAPALYAACSLHCPDDTVSINAGDRPFVFDIAAHRALVKVEQRRAIEATEVDGAATLHVVAQFLLAKGYKNTFTHLAEHYNATDTDAAALRTLDHRHALRLAILSGDLSRAISLATTHFPKSFPSSSPLYFRLQAQRFIEMVRGHVASPSSTSLDALIAFLRNVLGPIHVAAMQNSSLSPFERDLHRDVAALLAYADPAASPVAGLLDEERRRVLADDVNAAVLGGEVPLVERALGQLVGVNRALVECVSPVHNLASISL